MYLLKFSTYFKSRVAYSFGNHFYVGLPFLLGLLELFILRTLTLCYMLTLFNVMLKLFNLMLNDFNI